MKLINYFKDTKSEMRHVSWPNKKETTGLTLMVLALAIFTGLLLGLFDLIFQSGLQDVILK